MRMKVIGIKLDGRRWRLRKRKLGRDRVVGQCWSDGVIEVDCRLSQKRKLRTLLHELFHALDGDLSETCCEQRSKAFADAIWAEGYREMRMDAEFRRPRR